MIVLTQLIPDRFAVDAAGCNDGTSGGLLYLLDLHFNSSRILVAAFTEHEVPGGE